MFGKGIDLFTLFGFKVKLDYSWFFIALLLTWSLAVSFFPAMHEGFSVGTYWIMAFFGMLGLFLSIILHEIGHSLVARKYNLGISSITLFVFGGVADLKKEPESPGSEFYIAIAGPLASIGIAAFFYLASGFGLAMGLPLSVLAVFQYLWFINLLLVVFNMIPAFPLDGGRVLRAALWHYKGSLRSATKIASGFGSAFGVILIALGILGFATGNVIAGIWWVLIGFFVRAAASMSYKHVLLRRELEGESVRRFMKKEPVCVDPEMSLDELVNNVFYNHFHSTYPVVEDRRLKGYVGISEVKRFSPKMWQGHKVKEILVPTSKENTIEPEADAMQALSKMSRAGQSHLLVADNGNLDGMVTLKDLLRFFSLKIELEEGSITQANERQLSSMAPKREELRP